MTPQKRAARPWFLVGVALFLGLLALIAPLLVGHRRTDVGWWPNAAVMETQQIMWAIKSYTVCYNEPPVSYIRRQRSADFTFGTHGFKEEQPSIGSKGHADQTNNAELISVLLDLETFRNARPTVNARHLLNLERHKFLDAKQADGPHHGIDENGIYRDPWGHPYIITIDLNGDGYCDDPFHGKVKGEAFVWSFGPDGKADSNVKADEGVNADNITSHGEGWKIMQRQWRESAHKPPK